MRTVIPFDARNPKTRLSPPLTCEEREAFARIVLEDVLDVLAESPLDPEVVATEAVSVDVPLTVDDRSLDAVVNDAIDRETPLAIVMADLALLQPAQALSLVRTAGDVVIAPGRGGGTNALVVRDDVFRVDYHGASFRDHLAIADERGLECSVVDSFRLATDVDEPDDLLEVLIHGEGEAAEWLRGAGFRVETSGDRPVASRGASD